MLREQRLYAFWEYDLFPYCKGSEIEEILLNGNIRTVQKGYGGAIFKPFIILPLEQGLDLKLKLDGLATEFRSQERELNRKFKRLVDDIIKLPKFKK